MERFFLPISGPRLPRRITQLVIGLVLFGFGSGLMLQSDLGAPPWDVLHQGLSIQLGLTVGVWAIIVAFVVLLGWIPLRERYGLGTILNAIIIGLMIDFAIAVVPVAQSWLGRLGLMIGGIVLVGFASGLYIGAGLAPGPRDGLMTGIARRGPSLRLTRTVIEVVVVAVGWLLGGTFGAGTIAFAVLIGPIVQFFLPRWTVVQA